MTVDLCKALPDGGELQTWRWCKPHIIKPYIVTRNVHLQNQSEAANWTHSLDEHCTSIQTRVRVATSYAGQQTSEECTGNQSHARGGGNFQQEALLNRYVACSRAGIFNDRSEPSLALFHTVFKQLKTFVWFQDVIFKWAFRCTGPGAGSELQ